MMVFCGVNIIRNVTNGHPIVMFKSMHEIYKSKPKASIPNSTKNINKAIEQQHSTTTGINNSDCSLRQGARPLKGTY